MLRCDIILATKNNRIWNKVRLPRAEHLHQATKGRTLVIKSAAFGKLMTIRAKVRGTKIHRSVRNLTKLQFGDVVKGKPLVIESAAF